MSLYETIEVPSNEALATLDHYYKEYSSTGQFPFLIGDSDDLKQLQEAIEQPRDGGAEVIARATEFSVQEWFASQDAKKPKSVAKGVPPQSGWVTLTNLVTGEPKPRVHLGLLEVDRPAHIFAKLGFGDWNDCPAPHVHVALHSYWHEKFGSLPFALSSDIVECFVPKPPASADDVLTLASEQYAYCYDIVEQGFGSKSKLAASLIGANVWYFWWD
jgi:Domain of unknown function (DUF4253)